MSYPWKVWTRVSTLSPCSRSARGNILCPRSLSQKKVNSRSQLVGETVADSLFDLLRCQVVVVGKIRHRLSSPEAIDESHDADTSPRDRRAAEGDFRIDDDHFGSERVRGLPDRIEALRQARGVVFDPLEIRPQDFLDSCLAALRK